MNYIEGSHPLLESQSLPYTNATVRRAFIVWMYCGQKNSFKDVCNFYHYLELLEDKLPPDQRATSRYHEFNMFSNPPPTSPYLNELFPKLYTQNDVIQHYIKKAEALNKDSCLFKLDAFTDIKPQNGVTTNDILDTSNMIKMYCKSHMIPLKKFLTEFKAYAQICELNYTVNNVAFYIKRKMVEEEFMMVENYTKSLNFLNKTSVRKPDRMLDDNLEIDKPINIITNDDRYKFTAAINSQKITVLKRNHKKDLINQYWNDLNSNYTTMTDNNDITRT